MQEKVLFLEERYIIAAEYDYARAELLAILDSTQGPVSYQDIADRMMTKMTDKAVGNRVREFEERGLLERARSNRGCVYTVRKDALWQIMSEQGVTPTEDHSLRIDIPSLARLINQQDDTVNLTLSAIMPYTQGNPLTSRNGTSENPEIDQCPETGRSGEPKFESGSEDVAGQALSEIFRSSFRDINPSCETKITAINCETPVEVTLQTSRNGTSGENYENRHVIENTSNKASTKPSRVTTETSSLSTARESSSLSIGLESSSHNPASIYGDGKAISSPAQGKTSKKTKSKFYDWTHYDAITPEQWAEAKSEGVYPKGESANTMLIGAYLIAVKKRHNIEFTLAAGDFGKYNKLAKILLEFMTHRAGGDQQQGFRDALGWMHEFVSCDSTTFIGKSSWSIQLAFSRDMYRQVGTLRKTEQRAGERVKTGVDVLYSDLERRDRNRYGEGVYWTYVYTNHPDYKDLAMADKFKQQRDMYEHELREKHGWDDTRLAQIAGIRSTEATRSVADKESILYQRETAMPWPDPILDLD